MSRHLETWQTFIKMASVKQTKINLKMGRDRRFTQFVNCSACYEWKFIAVNKGSKIILKIILFQRRYHWRHCCLINSTYSDNTSFFFSRDIIWRNGCWHNTAESQCSRDQRKYYIPQHSIWILVLRVNRRKCGWTKADKVSTVISFNDSVFVYPLLSTFVECFFCLCLQINLNVWHGTGLENAQNSRYQQGTCTTWCTCKIYRRMYVVILMFVVSNSPCTPRQINVKLSPSRYGPTTDPISLPCSS